MSTMCWQDRLHQTFNRLHRDRQMPRVALIGVGHQMRGDDAVGVVLARRIQTYANRDHGLIIIDAGPAPENCTGILRRFAPDLVLMVDAAQMDKQPGTVCWLTWQTTTGIVMSTHSLPIQIFANYLVIELNCEVVLLGIQPMDTSFGAPLSPAVQNTVDLITPILVDSLINVRRHASVNHEEDSLNLVETICQEKRVNPQEFLKRKESS